MIFCNTEINKMMTYSVAHLQNSKINIVQLLIYLSQKYQIKFTWKYFANSHGKGGVDGVGG